jgi:two-component system LytT family sensor kinase
MFKTYQIKWFFILDGILIISTLLLHTGSFKEISWQEILNYILHISVILLISWLINGYFLVHKFSWLTNYAKHFLGNLLATISAFSIDYIYFTLIPKTHLIENRIGYETVPNIISHVAGAFFVSVICYIVFYSVHTNTALQTSKLENEILEQAHLRAQLLSLQQQISPHFLFNSLSTLKTITNEQHTKNYIVQLSTVYRYVLNFNEHYLTPLKDELAFIKSYLYIMEQRFEDTLRVTIDIPASHLELLIPPLSLQLLVENAIKHNMISPEQPLHISIMTDQSPALIVKNNFQPKKNPEEGTGMGLKNIKERYKLLMNKSISVVNEADFFSVTLPLLKK